MVLYLGAGNSVIGYALWNRALRGLPAAAVGASLYAQPMLGAGLSWLLLRDALPATFLPGAVLVLAGVYIATSARRASAASAIKARSRSRSGEGRRPRRAAGGVPAHRVGAAEVEVQPVEAHQLLAPALQLLAAGRVEAALAVEPVALDVHARGTTRRRPRHAVLDHVHDHLGDRRAQPVRAARADHQPHRRRPRSISVGACMLVRRLPGAR